MVAVNGGGRAGFGFSAVDLAAVGIEADVHACWFRAEALERCAELLFGYAEVGTASAVFDPPGELVDPRAVTAGVGGHVIVGERVA